MYEFSEARVMLREGLTLYSAEPCNTPSKAVKVLSDAMKQFNREEVVVVTLQADLRPIHWHTVSIGAIDQSFFPIPEIFRAALLDNATGVILLHNHPSGRLVPSTDDLKATERAIQAGKVIGIPVLDHVIVGGLSGETISLRETTDIFA